MSVYFENVEKELISRFKLKKLLETDFPEFHLKLLKINAINSLLNNQYQLVTEELNLHFYQIIENQGSQKYFTAEADYFPIAIDQASSAPILFVIVEEVLGILESNSNQLHTELLIKQGLSIEDSKSAELKAHIERSIQMYNENYCDEKKKCNKDE